MRMIEYPRLLYMANRMLHFDRHILKTEEYEGRTKMKEENANRFSDDDTLFDNYSPQIKRILLEAIKDKRAPQVLSYSP